MRNALMVESFELPDPLKSIFPLVLVGSLQLILIFPAGVARKPDRLMTATPLAAGISLCPEAMTVAPSHNFASILADPAVS